MPISLKTRILQPFEARVVSFVKISFLQTNQFFFLAKELCRYRETTNPVSNVPLGSKDHRVRKSELIHDNDIYSNSAKYR